MSTRTTFEDRLLAELRREVERRSSSAELTPEVPSARRRLLTGRRLALAAGVCTAAALAVVLAPGSPAESPAYAVERNADGTVTLSVHDTSLDREAQRELAERLRPYGVEVDIQNLPPGQGCDRPRGERLAGGFLMMELSPAGGTERLAEVSSGPSRTGTVPEPGASSDPFNWTVILHPGDSVGIENYEVSQPTESSRRLSVGTIYAFKGKLPPCMPGQ